MTPVFIIAKSGKRLYASLIDLLILFPVPFMSYIGCSVIIYLNFRNDENKLNEYIGLAAILCAFLYIVLSSLYFIFLQYYLKGQTFGKKAMQIKVVDEWGNIPTIKFLAWRYTTQLALMYFTGFLQYIMILVDPQRRALHDFLAKTYVVETKVDILEQ